jgi:hypothetical protein
MPFREALGILGVARSIVIVLVATIILLGRPISSYAEIWPTLDAYVRGCVLIVKTRAVLEEGGDFTYEVLESWKGVYDPENFVRTTPSGRLYATMNSHGLTDIVEGQEVIFFFTESNQPSGGKLAWHSTSFPVRDGKVVYGSSIDILDFSGKHVRREYGLEEFRQAIIDLAAMQCGNNCRPFRPIPPDMPAGRQRSQGRLNSRPTRGTGKLPDAPGLAKCPSDCSHPRKQRAQGLN